MELESTNTTSETQDLESGPKLFYSIKEAAKILKEKEPTLRFWESEFPDVIKPKRNNRGVRFYSDEDVDDIRRIKYLVRDCKLTLNGVRKRLKNKRDQTVRQTEIALRLKNIKSELKALGKVMDEINIQPSLSI